MQDKDGGGVGRPEWQVHPTVAPLPAELAIPKAWSDSFYETTLGAALQARGITQLVIVGMKTDYCVTMTSLRAVALGYVERLTSSGCCRSFRSASEMIDNKEKRKYRAAAGYETFFAEYTSVKATSYRKGGRP